MRRWDFYMVYQFQTHYVFYVMYVCAPKELKKSFWKRDLGRTKLKLVKLKSAQN